MRAIFVAAALANLSACASTGTVNTRPLQYAVVSPQLAAEASGVEVAAAAPASGVALGKVEAHACQHLNYDPFPTEELALTMLRAEAAKVGAKSVVLSKPLATSNVDLARNCFTTIHAYGVAYR